MSWITIILLVGLVVFITHALEAVTGFGCTVLAFPFVVYILGDVEQAKILLSILAWLLALYIAISKFKSINWRQFAVIALITGIGLPVGMYLFKSINPSGLKLFLGIVVIVSAGIQLYKLYFPKPASWQMPGWVSYIYLVAGGVVHGAFASGGPLVVLYSAKKLPGKAEFRATMCLLWATLNTILMVQFYLEDKLTVEVGKELLILLPFLIAGIFAGEAIHNRVNEMLFKKIIFVSLFVVGCFMVFVR